MRVNLPETPFDYLKLMDLLKDYSHPRVKISRMIKNQEIIKLKNGLYTAKQSDIELFQIANMLYSPSYVSMESALSYWGLIPERVYKITSITNKRRKVFENDLGTFTYNAIKSKAFHLGVQFSGSFLIASKEKAICDYVRSKNVYYSDMLSFFTESLRIEEDDLKELNIDLMMKVSDNMRSRGLKALIKQLKGLNDA